MDANTFTYLRARQRVAAPVRQQPAAAVPFTRTPHRPLLRRLFCRNEVTTFHRCLAVHMHFAQRSSVLR